MIVIFNGCEVRLVGTRSRFSAASVLAFAFSSKPTSVWIVSTFEPVFAFARCSSLTFSEVDTCMLNDEGFGIYVQIAFVTDWSLYHNTLFTCQTAQIHQHVWPKSFTEVNHQVHLNQESPTTSSSRDILFILSPFYQDKGPGGRQYRRNNSLDSWSIKKKTFLVYIELACQYHVVFRQQFRTDYRSQLLVPRRVGHHAVRRKLWTSLRCGDHHFLPAVRSRVRNSHPCKLAAPP